MILRSKPERYDGSWRQLLWETDDQGRCVSSMQRVEFDDMIDVYFEQRQKEFDRLLAKIMAGEISPVALYIQYHNMTVADVASRTRLGAARVRRHMTPGGFDGASIGMLKRYARVFGIDVGDFFCFTHVPDELSVDVASSPDRVVQRVKVSPGPADEDA
jgi:hypothetical protein